MKIRPSSALYGFIAVCLLTLSACSSSLVFSPGIHLPVKTLERSQVDVQGSVELFPETRPDNIDAKVSPGGSLQVGYGLSKKTAVYAKGWLDFSNRGMYATRSGFSLHVVQQVGQFSPDIKLLVLPKIGIAMDGKYRGGYGLELPVILHYSYRQKVSFYGGFGFIYGLVDFNKAESSDGNKLRSGYAVTNHIGSSVFLYKKLRLNAELTSLFQHNQFENTNHFIFSPSIGVGFTF